MWHRLNANRGRTEGLFDLVAQRVEVGGADALGLLVVVLLCVEFVGAALECFCLITEVRDSWGAGVLRHRPGLERVELAGQRRVSVQPA
jgi:hypothetical protein